MGADDDADCVEHIWVLDELHLSLDGAAQGLVCTRCAAVTFEGAGQGRSALPD
jgi:hypothetical protein